MFENGTWSRCFFALVFDLVKPRRYPVCISLTCIVTQQTLSLSLYIYIYMLSPNKVYMYIYIYMYMLIWVSFDISRWFFLIILARMVITWNPPKKEGKNTLAFGWRVCKNPLYRTCSTPKIGLPENGAPWTQLVKHTFPVLLMSAMNCGLVPHFQTRHHSEISIFHGQKIMFDV